MTGVPPFGYRFNKGELVEDTEEQGLLNRMREMCEEASYANVAGALNAEGALNRGKYWNPATIRYLMNREDGGAGD